MASNAAVPAENGTVSLDGMRFPGFQNTVITNGAGR